MATVLSDFVKAVIIRTCMEGKGEHCRVKYKDVLIQLAYLFPISSSTKAIVKSAWSMAIRELQPYIIMRKKGIVVFNRGKLLSDYGFIAYLGSTASTSDWYGWYVSGESKG